MKCPKCSAKLAVDTGGYAKANTTLGLGTPLPTNLSCPICGYYEEVFNDSPGVPHDFKNKNNYPDVRKSCGDAGWLKGMVQAEFNTIVRWRAMGKVWADIAARLTKKYPTPAETDPASVSNVYRRLMKERSYDDSDS